MVVQRCGVHSIPLSQFLRQTLEFTCHALAHGLAFTFELVAFTMLAAYVQESADALQSVRHSSDFTTVRTQSCFSARYG